MTPISVLLPFRDAAPTIDEAIASTLADLAPCDELVAIDDRSCDGGRARVEGWATRDARIVLVDGPGGIAGALARGASVARHELLARMDADDVSLPGRFAAQRALLEDGSLSVVSTQVEAFADAPAEVRGGTLAYLAWQNGILTPEEHARAMFVESPICHPTVALRKAALLDVGGYRDVPWPEDWDLWLRLRAAGHRFAKVPRVLVRWRRHAASTTARDPRCAPASLRAARARYLAPELVALRDRRVPFAIWGAGQTGRRLARALAAHGAIPATFVDIDPRKIGRTAQGAPIVSAEEVLAIVRERPLFVVVAVGDRGARDVVRGRLLDGGLVEGADFLASA